MYSVVLMMALSQGTTQAEAGIFRHHGRHGCAASCNGGYSGCCGSYNGGYGGCNGGFAGCNGGGYGGSFDGGFMGCCGSDGGMAGYPGCMGSAGAAAGGTDTNGGGGQAASGGSEGTGDQEPVTAEEQKMLTELVGKLFPNAGPNDPKRKKFEDNWKILDHKSRKEIYDDTMKELKNPGKDDNKQSRLPFQVPATKAYIEVVAPQGTVLTFDGAPTSRSDATDRWFVTPELTPGKDYFVILRAEYREAGQKRTAARFVYFQPGQAKRVQIGLPTGTIAQN